MFGWTQWETMSEEEWVAWETRIDECLDRWTLIGGKILILGGLIPYGIYHTLRFIMGW